jgi:hypothetical protein
MEPYILISLYNYFIMHDIKHVFLNKINQTIQEEGQITEKYYCSKSKGAVVPPPPLVHYESAPVWASSSQCLALNFEIKY